jgi:hypothetical protein
MEERGRPRTRRDVHMLDVDDNSSRRVDSSDRRSLSRSRARSRSRSPVQQRYHANSVDVRNQFEKIGDIFHNRLFITYGTGILIDHDLIKDHIETFFIKNAQDDAPTIVKKLLEDFPKERFPIEKQKFFLYIKAKTYISSNNSAPINVRLYPNEAQELISKIYKIFELELEKQEAEKRRQENEKQTDALSEMLASSSIGTANIAKGNKTYYTNKKTYRRKKNTYNSRNKKPKNKKHKNKKTYRLRHKRQ